MQIFRCLKAELVGHGGRCRMRMFVTYKVRIALFRKVVIGWMCSSYGIDKKFTEKFGQEASRKNICLEYQEENWMTQY
jgi:hypothetical protein